MKHMMYKQAVNTQMMGIVSYCMLRMRCRHLLDHIHLLYVCLSQKLTPLHVIFILHIHEMTESYTTLRDVRYFSIVLFS